MTQKHINLGNYPNDPSADTMYVAFPKVEANFDDLYNGAAIINASTSVVTATGSTAARTLGSRFADIANVLDDGAVADGKKAVLLVSIAANSTTLTVALPAAWVASTAYTAGQVVTNNGRAYTCVVAGASGTVGPISDSGTGGAQVDNTAKWHYIGPAASTANVFSAADVGKILTCVRQDTYGGTNPWWTMGPAGGFLGHVTIAHYNSPTSVTVTVAASATGPSGASYPSQSWPYSGTPAIMIWGTDNSAALQRAHVRGAGGAVFYPAGAYCWGSQVVVYSNTTIYGVAGQSILLPCGINDPTGQSNGAFGLINYSGSLYYTASLTGTPTNDSTPAFRAKYGDQNIIYRDLAFDSSASAVGVSNGWMSFMVANLGQFNLQYWASPIAATITGSSNWYGCDNVQMDGCNIVNMDGPYPFGGSTNCVISKNRIVVPGNYQSTYYGLSLQQQAAIEINVVGNQQQGDEYSNVFRITGNQIYLNGSLNSSYSVAGISVAPAGTDSVIQNVIIDDNQIICAGANNQPITIDGLVDGPRVSSNQIVGATGEFGGVILAIASTGNTGLYSAITNMTTNNGSPIVTIVWPGHGFSGANLALIPCYFYCSAGPTVGGLTLLGFYPITSVTTGSITINAGSNASSTASGTWGGVYATINCPPQHVEISGNTLTDCSTSTFGLIRTNCVNATVRHNRSVLSNNAATGSYPSLVNFSNFTGAPTGNAQFNTGPVGTGSVQQGNNRVSWQSFTPAPIIVDLDDYNGSLIVTNANAPSTVTGSTYTVATSDYSLIFNGSATCTVTLPSASNNKGRSLRLKTIAAYTVVSASANVVPLVGGSASTAILAATAGKWAEMESDGTNWQLMMSN